MLLLLFKLGDGRYALPVDHIVEVIPLVKLKKVPRTPEFVAGMMNYRGKPVPVIDLSVLSEGVPSELKMSTRIIVVNYPFEEKPGEILGLIAKNATETIKSKLESAPASGVVLDETLDHAVTDLNSDGLLQWFDLKKILPEQEISVLFQD